MHLLFLNTVFRIVKEYEKVRKTIKNEFHLSGAEVDVLLFLANNPEMQTAQDIVDYRKLTKSHVSLAVSQLVDKGLISRTQNKRNKKEFILNLTKKADKLIEFGRQKKLVFYEDLFVDFEQKEKDQFMSIIKRLHDHLVEEDLLERLGEI